MSPRVWVPGVPAAQGSKRHVGGGRMIESSKAVGPWRERVGSELFRVLGEDHEPTRAAVAVHLRFVTLRPKGHYGTGKNAETIKPSAPRLPIGRPDLDKLTRAILDAMTGVAFADDAQVAALNCGKEYGNTSGVEIRWDVIA